MTIMIEKSYVTVVENIKAQIRSAQHRAILNANKEMLILYWNIYSKEYIVLLFCYRKIGATKGYSYNVIDIILIKNYN